MEPIGPTEQEELKNRFILLSRPLSPVPTGTEPRLKKLEGIRYVIFDFYGTLFISGVGDIGIDEEGDRREQFQLALAACGLPAGPEAAASGLKHYNDLVQADRDEKRQAGVDHPEPVVERIWLQVLEKLSAAGLTGRAADGELARRFAVEFELRVNPVWPMPGLDRMLLELRQSERTLGIISNSQFYTPIAFEALARSTIDRMGFDTGLLHWSFEERLKKPSVEFYRRFLKKLTDRYPGADAGEVLYIGNDMLKDVWPASQTGMRTALFAGDERSLRWRRDDGRCAKLRPDLVVTDLLQIADCLD